MVGEVSCEYCRDLNGRTIGGDDGFFFVSKRTLRRSDGAIQVWPILRYDASDEVFSCDIEIEDHVVINYCPMCGADLTEGL